MVAGEGNMLYVVFELLRKLRCGYPPKKSVWEWMAWRFDINENKPVASHLRKQPAMFFPPVFSKVALSLCALSTSSYLCKQSNQC